MHLVGHHAGSQPAQADSSRRQAVIVVEQPVAVTPPGHPVGDAQQEVPGPRTTGWAAKPSPSITPSTGCGTTAACGTDGAAARPVPGLRTGQ